MQKPKQKKYKKMIKSLIKYNAWVVYSINPELVLELMFANAYKHNFDVIIAYRFHEFPHFLCL